MISIPLYYIGSLIGNVIGTVAWYNSILLLLFSYLLYKEVSKFESEEFATDLLLLLFASSMIPAASEDYYSEMFTAVTACYAILVMRRKPLRALLIGGFGIANTPAAVVAYFFALVRIAWKSKKLRYLFFVLVPIALILLERILKFGTIFHTGYENNHSYPTVLPYSTLPDFSYPLFFGVLSLTLSFGKGILFFTPGLALARRASMPRSEEMSEALVALLWFVAGLILVYARWWAWYGGWSWGPRFLLIAAVPASILLVRELRQRHDRVLRRLFLLGVLALALWVGLNGLIFHQSNMAECVANNYRLEPLCWYTPEFSALWRPFIAPSHIALRYYLAIAMAPILFVYLGRNAIANVFSGVAAWVSRAAEMFT